MVTVIDIPVHVWGVGRRGSRHRQNASSPGMEIDMGTMVVTGSASGMGAAIVSRLEGRGDRVITVDLHDAAVVADLSTVQGRVDAAHKVLELSEGHIDGAVMAAGLGPKRGGKFLPLIARSTISVSSTCLRHGMTRSRPATPRSS